MKKIIISTILIISLAILVGQSWQPVGNLHHDFNSLTRLAINSQNTPYLAGLAENGNDIIVKKLVNGNWEIISNITASNRIGNFNFIVKANTPYVLYQTHNLDDPIVLKRLVNEEWETISSPTTFPTGQNLSYSLAISNNGVPYIAYKRTSIVEPITVKKLVNGNWEIVGGLVPEINNATRINLAIDLNDETVYLGYQSYSSQFNNSKITVKKLINGNWEIVGQERFSTTISEPFALAINGGTPYVAYSDRDRNSKVTVMGFINETWSIVGYPAFSDFLANSIGLAFANSTPYVSFRDYLNDELRLTVMRFVNGIWETVGPPRFSVGMASFPAIAIDGNNTPYVVYNDYGFNFQAIVQKFTGELFEGNPRNGYLPLAVNFNSQAILTAPIVSWEWNFGDGSSSTLQNPEKTYSQPGQFSVQLTVVDQFGATESLLKDNYITVLDPAMIPKNLSIAINGRNVVLNWDRVLTIAGDDIVDVSGYVVYHSNKPNENFLYLGFTDNPTFTHQRVTQFSQKTFYRVTTFTGDSRRLTSLVARNPNFKIGQLESLLAAEK
ncbi:MAG: PKD domain-containing protein [Sphaerochaetaceae bacterium]|jgi:hypothetical protein